MSVYTELRTWVRQAGAPTARRYMTRVLLALLIAVPFMGSAQQEGIVLVGSKDDGTSLPTMNFTTSFTVPNPTTDNTVLAVNVSISDCTFSANGFNPSTFDFGFVSWAGPSASPVAFSFANGGDTCGQGVTGRPRTETFYLKLPEAGAGTLRVKLHCRSGWTCSPAPPSPDVVVAVYAFKNVNQSEVIDASVQGNTYVPCSPQPTCRNPSVDFPPYHTASPFEGGVLVHGIVTSPAGFPTTLDSDLQTTYSRTAGTTVTVAGYSGVAVASATAYPGFFPEFISWPAAGTRWASTLMLLRPQNYNAVSGVNFEAGLNGGLATLRWRTGSEVSNLGFNVIRDDAGVQIRVNPSLIAGSVFLVGPKSRLAQGRGYEWVDPRPVNSMTRYWLEALDLNGRVQRFGPVTAGTMAASRDTEGDVEYVKASLAAELGGSAAEAIASGMPAFTEANDPIPPGAARFSVDAAPIETQREIAAGKALKLSVGREGWYRVTSSQVASAGFSMLDSRYLQLYEDGVQIPMAVSPDSRAGYSLDFYGRPLDTQYTSARTYWLIQGKTPGLRFQKQAATQARVTQPSGFPFTVERKDRTLFFAALTGNGENSNFFGPVVSGSPVSQILTVTKLDTLDSGSWPLRVSLQGVTKDVSHQVEVRINGNVAGLMAFKGQENGRATMMVPRAWLVEGSNSVVLTAIGGAEDVCLVDSIRLTYPHRFETEAGVLKFTAPAGMDLSLAGPVKLPIRVLDITDPSSPIELVMTQVPGGGATGVVPGNYGDRTLIAVVSGSNPSPDSIRSNVVSAWHGDRTATDLAIISHSSFIGAANRLKELRQAQGLLAKVIDVEDLYDEYSFGAKDAAAIKAYLAAKQPRYVVLMGDSTFDPRNYLGFGNNDFVPSRLVATSVLKTASDDWFTDFSGSGFAGIPIGRIAVRTLADANVVVENLAATDGARAVGSPWLNKVVHVADQNDAGSTYSFETQVQTLFGDVPGTYMKRQILVGQLGAATAHQNILSEMNDGALLYTYVGHGSQDTWSKLNVFGVVDAGSLTSGARVPLLLPLNCLNGLFVDLMSDSLAERLQKQAGGPAAIWSSSGLTEPLWQTQLARTLYQQVFSRTGVRLGDAIRAAKAAVEDADVRKTWILFGDPSMIVR